MFNIARALHEFYEWHLTELGYNKMARVQKSKTLESIRVIDRSHVGDVCMIVITHFVGENEEVYAYKLCGDNSITIKIASTEEIEVDGKKGVRRNEKENYIFPRRSKTHIAINSLLFEVCKVFDDIDAIELHRRVDQSKMLIVRREGGVTNSGVLSSKGIVNEKEEVLED